LEPSKKSKRQGNVHITVDSSITTELKIDQSVAHNGICLTVVELKELLFSNRNWRNRSKTNLGNWVVGDNLNLERAMKRPPRRTYEGHGREPGTCIEAQETNGSWYYTEYDEALNNLTIEKVQYCQRSKPYSSKLKKNQFSVAIIPYTYEHTNFNSFVVGTKINLEFDVIGKYVSKWQIKLKIVYEQKP
jgi:riboflavin synthase